MIAEALGERRYAELALAGWLRRAWPRLVGAMLAAHTEPVGVDASERALIVACSHPLYAQQMRLFARFLLARLRQEAPAPVLVERVRTRIVPAAGYPLPEPVRKNPPPMRIKRRVALQLRGIRDPVLRRAMFAAWLAALGYAPRRLRHARGGGAAS